MSKPGFSFTCRIRLPVPSNKPDGSLSAAPLKKPTLTCDLKVLTYPNAASFTHATGQPSCISSRTSSPHSRICANHFRAIERSSSGFEFSQTSTAGSRSMAPENRSIAFITWIPRAAPMRSCPWLALAPYDRWGILRETATKVIRREVLELNEEAFPSGLSAAFERIPSPNPNVNGTATNEQQSTFQASGPSTGWP
jgi:hypothetical protein